MGFFKAKFKTIAFPLPPLPEQEAIAAVISSLEARMPTGPSIILVVSALTVFSLLFSPRRGVLAERWRRLRQRRRVRLDTVLADLYRLCAQHPEPEKAPHTVGALVAMGSDAGVLRSLRGLAEQGLVDSRPDGRWCLTAAGVDIAVAGSAVFNSPDPVAAIRHLKQNIVQ